MADLKPDVILMEKIPERPYDKVDFGNNKDLGSRNSEEGDASYGIDSSNNIRVDTFGCNTVEKGTFDMGMNMDNANAAY